MNHARMQHGRGAMVALVLSTVLIQIAVAVLLKELANAHGGGSTGVFMLVVATAIGLNGLRFLVWGYTHKHYPLSHSYPLTALFFPCILLIAAFYGERIGWAQVAGVATILLGLILMTWEGEDGASANAAR